MKRKILSITITKKRTDLGLFDIPDLKLGTKVAGIASYFKIFVPISDQADRAKMA